MTPKNASICAANLKLLFNSISNEAKKASKEWADDTMTISKEIYCPYKTGKLRSTGKVETVTDNGTDFRVELSYGEGINYAIPVHEIPRYHVKGQAQYLSTPFNSRIDTLQHELHTKCKSVMK